MRMWNIPPRLLCDKHLLGEHVEMHMFAGALRNGRSIEGHVARGQVETGRIAERHDELAVEMTRRGMRHRSPLEQPDCSHVGRVDLVISLSDLAGRCKDCRERIKTHDDSN